MTKRLDTVPAASARALAADPTGIDVAERERPPAKLDTLATAAVRRREPHRWALPVKRAVDIAGAAIGLAFTLPLFPIVSLAIRSTSSGPTIFWQVRCGKDGRMFAMPKLRTMVLEAELQRESLDALNEMDGPAFKMRNDPRVTRVGRFLRRYSLDEFPQLWSVLVGHMSLVGPRPPLPSEVANYSPRQQLRLSMRPGITCLWQIAGRNKLGFAEWVELDLAYVRSWSLTRDFVILLKTIPTVLRGTGW